MDGIIPKDKFNALSIRRPSHKEGHLVRGVWNIKCFDKNGKLKWEDKIENLVVNAGLDHILDAVLAAGSQITTWYVGITNTSPSPAAGDTMASHGGWVENQNYDEATRQTWTDGGVSSQSVDNSGSKATFTIDTNTQTIGGAFLTSDNTKGGSSGTLYAVGAFSGGDKSADDDDTLQVTATFTSADDGV